MSYEFLSGVGYRMPSHFGPSPGPRQKVDGTLWQRDEVVGNTTTLSVSYLTHREKLEALLPPRFELFEEPVITVSAQNLKNLWWLAGRGYNILSVTFRATFRGAEETLTGNFMPVLGRASRIRSSPDGRSWAFRSCGPRWTPSNATARRPAPRRRGWAFASPS